MPRPITVRLNDATLAELDQLAAAMERDRSYLIAEAVEAWLTEQRAFVAAVQEGIRQMEAGEVVPHEEVLRELGLERTDAGS